MKLGDTIVKYQKRVTEPLKTDDGANLTVLAYAAYAKLDIF